MAYDFLKTEKFGLREQLSFTREKLEIYIPAYFFEDGIAEVVGNLIHTLGLFWFKVDGKETYECEFPIAFDFAFSEQRKSHERVKPGLPELDYVIYTLHKGDAFVYNTNHRKDLDDLMGFIDKMIEGGKIPPDISYDEVFNIFLNMLNATGYTGGLGISATTMEIILSQLFRCKGNMSKPFRMGYNGSNPYDYKMVRITKVPEMSSTFMGLMGEDLDQQLISAVNRTREGVTEIETPIEKTIKY